MDVKGVIILLLLVIVWILHSRCRLVGILCCVFVPDVAKDRGFIFRGLEVPEDMIAQCHVPEDMIAQCHVPEDLNSNFRFYKNWAKYCLYNSSI